MNPAGASPWNKPVVLQLIFDFILMAATSTYAVFAIKQWSAMSGQLEEMRKSSVDTHALAQAAIDQVAKLQAGVDETHRLALDAETANTNALAAERPWMGASIGVKDFEVGKTPTFSITFVNSGRRPAKLKLTAGTSKVYEKFPTNPAFEFDTTPSTSIDVPGQPSLTSWNGKSPLSDAEISVLKSGTLTFYVYGKIEYSDVRTGASYWTHVCWRYIPGMTFVNNGFLNCTEYNDAR